MYPSLNMTVDVTLSDASVVLNNPTSVSMNLTLMFNVPQPSGPMNAFSLLFQLYVQETSMPPTITNNQLTFSGNFSSYNF
jgi:hypothetical protein